MGSSRTSVTPVTARTISLPTSHAPVRVRVRVGVSARASVRARVRARVRVSG